MSRRVLTDLQGVYKLSIVEGQQGGKLVVEGKIGHCDQPTANGRVYPRSVMEREINRLKPKIEAVSVYSAVDHPGDGKTRIKDSGALVRDIWLETNGEIKGRFEVVEEAPAGQALAAFLRRGASVGMSSRGMGSTMTGPNGHDVVGEDFRLNTWDFVSDPACQDAYPSIVSESEELEKITEDYLRARHSKLVQAIEEKAYATAQCVVEEDARERITGEATGEAEKTAEEAIRLAAPKIREEMKAEVHSEVRKELNEDFAVKLVRALAEMKESVTEEVRSAMASDPEVAGAKTVIKKIAEMLAPYKAPVDVEKVLSEKDSKAASLEAQLKTEQAKVADLDRKGRVLAYAVFVEQKIGGREDAPELRKLIGKLDEVKSVKDLEARVSTVIAEANKHRTSAQKEADEKLASLREEADARVKEAESRALVAAQGNRKIREAVEERVETVSKQLKAVTEDFEKKLAKKDEEIAKAKSLTEQSGQRTLTEQTGKDALVRYARERTVGHAKASAIVEEVASGKLVSRDAINVRATKLEEGAQEPGGVAERIRRAMSQGRETVTEDERVKIETTEEAAYGEDGEAAHDLAEIGTSLTEQTHLARGPRRAL